MARPFVPEPSRVSLGLQSRGRSRCPELDCLRHRLPPGTLAAAEQRAVALGIGADRVLITAGVLTEDEYVRALAAWLHVPFEPLDVPRAACPLPGEQFIDAAKFGLLPLHIGGAFIYVIAPQVLTARRLVTGAHPLPKDRFRLTSPLRLRQFVLRHGANALGARAADALRTARPELSAAVCPPPVRAAWLAGMAAVVSAVIVFPGPAAVLTSAALALTFLAWTALRLFGAATAWRGWRAIRLPPHDLPIYTIIVALYDEATAVPGLIAALRRLDYPREKLQIILALEPDDLATQSALARLELGPPFEIVIAPDRGRAPSRKRSMRRSRFRAARSRPCSTPRTARRRISFTARSTRSWRKASAIACVQARLTIDNTRRLARAAVHRRVCGAVRCAAAGPVGARAAAAAWRLIEPFPHRRAASGRRLGSLQCHRRRRPRHAARPLRLSARP